jgi:hypothetical protein
MRRGWANRSSAVVLRDRKRGIVELISLESGAPIYLVRLKDAQQTLPMTPMHDAPPPQQSPLESPVYGQNVDLPHYELMIVNALTAINDPNGSPPKTIWDWMNRWDFQCRN